jgi:hypothetical protein
VGSSFSPPVLGTRLPSPASRWRPRREFVAIATFHDDWYSVELPQLPGLTASSSSRERVEEAVRDVISLALTVGPESFDVHVIFVDDEKIPPGS